MAADATPRYDEEYFRDTYGVDGMRRFSMHWWSARLYAGISERWLRRVIPMRAPPRRSLTGP